MAMARHHEGRAEQIAENDDIQGFHNNNGETDETDVILEVNDRM